MDGNFSNIVPRPLATPKPVVSCSRGPVCDIFGQGARQNRAQHTRFADSERCKSQKVGVVGGVGALRTGLWTSSPQIRPNLEALCPRKCVLCRCYAGMPSWPHPKGPKEGAGQVTVILAHTEACRRPMNCFVNARRTLRGISVSSSKEKEKAFLAHCITEPSS